MKNLRGATLPDGLDVITYRDSFTSGDWLTEAESAAAFDEVVTGTGLFTIYREVRGVYVQPRVDQPLSSPRIDRILSPTKRLLAAGWSHGPIGVECKASGVNCGPPLSQMLDYSRAIWSLPNGFRIQLAWIFLWPLGNQGGVVQSIMAQNRLGSANSSQWVSLSLYSGGKILRVRPDGEVEIGLATNGRKVGSR